jgi:hypothetical protein
MCMCTLVPTYVGRGLRQVAREGWAFSGKVDGLTIAEPVPEVYATTRFAAHDSE